jgi:hypothetical protein
MAYIDQQLAAADAKESSTFRSRSERLQQAESDYIDIGKDLEAAGFK